MPQSRRCIQIGLIGGLTGFVVWLVAWMARDPNPPPRFSISHLSERQVATFSVDGRSLLSQGPDGSFVWDLSTSRSLPDVTPPRPLLQKRAFTRDQMHFAGWNVKDAEIVWGDTVTETIRGKLSVPPIPLTIIPDLTWIDGDRELQIILWDLAKKPRIDEVITWNVASGATSRRFVLGPGTLWHGPIAWSPDGQTWVYATLRQDALQFWNPATDQAIGNAVVIPSLPGSRISRAFVTASFTHDGQTLIVSGDDGQVTLWDVATQRSGRSIRVFSEGFEIHQLDVSPDDRTLVASGFIPRSQTTLGRYNDDATRMLSGQPKMYTSYLLSCTDLTDGRPLGQYHRTSFMGFSRDGRLFATIDFRDSKYSVYGVPRSNRP